MKIKIGLFFFISYYYCCIGNSQDRYNLGFEGEQNKIPQWFTSGNGCSISCDKTAKKQGQNSFMVCLKNDPYTKITGATTKLGQSFLVPKAKNRGTLKISIYSKGDPKWDVSLNVIGLSDIEDIVVEKKIKYTTTDTWRKDSLIFDIRNAKLLTLNIELNLDKSFLNNDATIGPIWLDKLEMAFENVDINKYSVNVDCGNLSEFIEKTKTPLTTPLIAEISAINEFNDAKIIALGETIHGSSTINKIAFQTMRQLVENQNVKLILIEMPIDLVTHWNYYISNKTNISIEEFFPIGALYDPIELKKLLDWLQYYNLHNNDKVSIVGIDKAGTYKADCYLKHFLSQTLPPSPILDTISQNLCGFNTQTYVKAQASLMRYWKFFNSQIDKKALLIFNQALKGLAMKVYPPNELFEGTRDYIFAQNAIFAIDSLLKNNEKALIYSHFQHTSKICNYINGANYSTMGSYLNEKYGNEFYNIGLLVGTGTFTANNDSMIVDNNTLGTPILGSIEQKCLDMNNELFFSSLSSASPDDNLCYYRNKGNFTGINQFYIGNIQKRTDAVIFVKNSTGFKIPEHWPLYTKDWFWFLVKQYNMNQRKSKQ